jgi:hypothetical protein
MLSTRTWTAAMWYRQHIVLDRLAETLWGLERMDARVGWPREGDIMLTRTQVPRSFLAWYPHNTIARAAGLRCKLQRCSPQQNLLAGGSANGDG